MTELDRHLDEAQAADRIAADERADVPALVAAYRVRATGEEALEQRDRVAAGDRVLEADARAECQPEVPHERLIAPDLADDADEVEVAAEERADRLDGQARRPTAVRIERILGRVHVDAEAETRQEAMRRCDRRPERLDLVVHVRERVVLEPVEHVRRDDRRRTELDPRAHARAVVEERLLVLLLLGQRQAKPVARPGKVRLDEVRGDRPVDE